MGILDEAIREHLDLKRRQGANQDELQRLEDEAFGPPSRPGDPDFPESSELAAAPGADEGAAPEAEAPAVERAEPAETPTSEEAMPTPQPEAPAADEAPSGEETSPFYDHAGDESDELEIDLDLEPEDEPAVATSESPPIESQDTVEHHFEGAIDEAEVVEEESEPASEEPPPGADQPVTEDHPMTVEEPPVEDSAGEGDAEEDEADADDVLEETPEFLQDAPEDDELWFEQGEPKDFDF